jgi:ribosomal protein L7/L12
MKLSTTLENATDDLASMQEAMNGAEQVLARIIIGRIRRDLNIALSTAYELEDTALREKDLQMEISHKVNRIKELESDNAKLQARLNKADPSEIEKVRVAIGDEFCGFSELHEEDFGVVLGFARDRKLIDAIKYLRAHTGCGLKEGKDAIERVIYNVTSKDIKF